MVVKRIPKRPLLIGGALFVVAILRVSLFFRPERPPLERGRFETEICAAALRYVLGTISEETKKEAQIGYLSLGNRIGDVASPGFLEKFRDEPFKFVDGSSFRDKAYADRRFIVDISTGDQLTPLHIQVRTIERLAAGGYQLEIGWAYKKMLSRKFYHVDESVTPHVVTVTKAVDVRDVRGEPDMGQAAEFEIERSGQ